MSILAYETLTKNQYASMQFMDNWHRQPITEIQGVGASEPCPTGFEGISNRTWPGTANGCDCSLSDVESYKGILKKGLCSSKYKSNGCTDVVATDEQSLDTLWGTKLCVK